MEDMGLVMLAGGAALYVRQKKRRRRRMREFEAKLWKEVMASDVTPANVADMEDDEYGCEGGSNDDEDEEIGDAERGEASQDRMEEDEGGNTQGSLKDAEMAEA
jgi:hypothetical protein